MIIRTTPELSTLASLLPPILLEYISTASHLTVFAPTNEAWNTLSELELYAFPITGTGIIRSPRGNVGAIFDLDSQKWI
jgi:hypothetical protein